MFLSHVEALLELKAMEKQKQKMDYDAVEVNFSKKNIKKLPAQVYVM